MAVLGDDVGFGLREMVEGAGLQGGEGNAVVLKKEWTAQDRVHRWTICDASKWVLQASG